MLIALLIVVAMPFAASAEELGRTVFNRVWPGPGGFCSGEEQLELRALTANCEWAEVGWSCFKCDLWDDISLSTADVGTTLTATADTHPCFSTLAQFLTDDVTQLCGIDFRIKGGCGSVMTGTENGLFSLDGNDFHGATIESFAVRLDSLRFERNPSGLVRAYFALTWIVEGSWATPTEATTWGRIKALYSE